ncbi:UDG domain-containing protein [Mycena kentingensis (nom. inval.)]|nr:UDG domain-containing protein [Mycena kentingensis (nom. inval.)]
MSDSLSQFKTSISRFSYAAGVQPTSGGGESIRSSPRSSPTKRPAAEPSSEPKQRKKKKRSYAPPEAYPGLSQVPDYLGPDLDVIFCGINPGMKSAEYGCHYGNPSNHFWWCLHNSGFTDTQISPKNDFTLPERFSLGLTNLVDRPTAQQSELSAQEQLDSAPVFLGKIAHYRPCIVFYTGLSIAKAVETKLGITHTGTQSWGLRQYKIVHSNPSLFGETLFFAAPSTSGLVTHFKRPEKARIFGEARQLVADIKAGRISTAGMYTVKSSQITAFTVPQLNLETPTPLRLSPDVKDGEEDISVKEGDT